MLLAAGADIDARDHQARTPLRVAAGAGNTTVTKALLGAGAQIETPDAFGHTPLHAAAMKDDPAMLAERFVNISQGPSEPEILNALLAAGAGVGVRGKKGATPLHVAAAFGNAATTDALLAAGAELQARDVHGRTALHLAAGHHYDEEAMQALLAGGASLEARDGEGRTPLHYALSEGSPRGARALLAAGADSDSRDTAGWTPLHYGAAQGGDRAGGDFGEWVVLATGPGRGVVASFAGLGDAHYTAAVGVLVAAGATVDARARDGRTPLHVAAARRSEDTVGVLLDAGADGTARTASGETPLDKAHKPVSNAAIDYAETDQARFRKQLFDALRSSRNLAVRLGEVRKDRDRSWILDAEPQKALLNGRTVVEDLTDDDFTPALRQKGVDMRTGLDIASLTLKGHANIIILVSGDADFVPAAKLARRESMQLVLDPLWQNISPDPNEHIDGLRSGFPKPRLMDSRLRNEE